MRQRVVITLARKRRNGSKVIDSRKNEFTIVSSVLILQLPSLPIVENALLLPIRLTNADARYTNLIAGRITPKHSTPNSSN